MSVLNVLKHSTWRNKNKHKGINMLKPLQKLIQDQVNAENYCFCHTKMSSKCKMLEIKTNEKSRFTI